MAYLEQTGSTDSSVTITCEGLEAGHGRTRYFWWQLWRNGAVEQEHGDEMAPGGTSHATTFSGLPAGTTYSVLCGIYDDPQYQTRFALLSGSASTTSPTGPYIYSGGQWKRATPYIWNGSQWVQAQANIYSGGSWKS